MSLLFLLVMFNVKTNVFDIFMYINIIIYVLEVYKGKIGQIIYLNLCRVIILIG